MYEYFKCNFEMIEDCFAKSPAKDKRKKAEAQAVKRPEMGKKERAQRYISRIADQG